MEVHFLHCPCDAGPHGFFFHHITFDAECLEYFPSLAAESTILALSYSTTHMPLQKGPQAAPFVTTTAYDSIGMRHYLLPLILPYDLSSCLVGSFSPSSHSPMSPCTLVSGRRRHCVYPPYVPISPRCISYSTDYHLPTLLSPRPLGTKLDATAIRLEFSKFILPAIPYRASGRSSCAQVTGGL